jgi:ABC-type phosphate transport system substrate-binding protein
MSKLKTHILTTACLAVIGSIGFSAGASAVSLDVYGGGSSLVAPYARQAMDCYALPTQLIFKGTPPTFVSETPFNYVNPPHSQDCSTTHIKSDRTIHYISTGSGTGIAALFSHDPTKYGFVDAGQTQYFPEVYYGLSDAGLASSDVAIYNGGGVEQGVTVVAPGVTPGVGEYGNPLQLFGPMIQFPASIDPVAVAYDPVYKKVFSSGTVTKYKLNIHFTRTDGSGGLRLDATTYCKIFNGQITNWNDPALKTLNGNKSLEDPADPTPAGSWSVPLQIVGRMESSGTTSIFTRHLANVCASLAGNAYADGNTLLPSALIGPTYDKTQINNSPAGETLGKFTVANGSDGVSKYVAFTTDPTSDTPTIIQGRVGYVGPDYALPAVLTTNANTYGLNTASLKNTSGQYEAPTGKAAQAAYKVLSPPQSDPTGHYDSSQPGNRADPSQWVQSPSKTSALANPTTSGAYPIVGSTNFLGYTCYKVGGQETTLDNFVNWYVGALTVTDGTNGILAKAGLAPLPPNWRTAIKETFTSDPNGLGLKFAKVGTAGACSVAGVKGG